MADEYLWDRTGPVDPDVEALEQLLVPYAATRGGTPRLPAAANASERLGAGDGAPRPAAWPTTALAAAALAVLAIGAAWVGRAPVPSRTSGPAVAWEIAPLDGRPRVASRIIDGPRQVGAGTWITTDGSSSARLELGDAGRLVIAPDSTLQVERAAPGAQHVHLAHGTIDALVWAPPGQVVVRTPVATAVDLGCAYTLTLDRRGEGSLRVTSGWVGLAHEGREAFVPAGAAVAIHPATGPGTPVLVAADPRLRAAVQRFDAGTSDLAQADALTEILDTASPGDALTLWHLLTRVEASSRGRVYDAFAARLAPPDGVTRAGVLAGDRDMLDAWWAALGYGDRAWWELWVREWRPAS